jgi:hypothetical protein
MKYPLAVVLLVLPALAIAGAEQLIPSGSVMQCTVSEPNVSSKTTHIGDPVLCRLSRSELYGRSTVPYGSYLVGHFEDYKDPGHFIGKGWMELRFDRMVVDNDTVIPVSTRVVATPKYNVDADGRILGKGHPVRDLVEWSIPVLWPIDLISLPRRGPRPVLGPETRLTVKILDDFGIPTREEAAEQNGLIPRRLPAPVEQAYQQPQYQQQQQPAPVQQAYQPQPAQNVVIVQAPAQPAPVIVQQAPPTVVYRYAPPPPPVYVPYGYGYYRPY